MIICPRCKKPVSDSANFCGSCGLPRSEMERYYAQNPQQNADTVSPDIPPDSKSINTNNDGTDYTTNENVNTKSDPTENTSDNDFAGGESYGENLNIGDNAGGDIENTQTDTDDKNSLNTPGETPQDNVGGTAYKGGFYTRNPGTDYSSYDSGRNYDYVPPNYIPPYPTQGQNTNLPEDQNLTTVDYIYMLILSGLPIVGIIYLIYNGFFQNKNVNRRNFARARLILMVFEIVLAFVFVLGFRSTGAFDRFL
jgi:ribosomal protein L37E